MMSNSKYLNRSGLAAIAAATALLSTPAFAQDAAPIVADPAPIVADTPLPAEPAPAVEAVPDALAPAATTTTTTTTRTTRSASPTRATAGPTARTVRAPATAVANPVNSASTAPVADAPVADATPPFDPAMVAPLPKPAVAAPAPVDSGSMIDNDLLPIAGAAGLGILALAGAGFAMRRRRRDDEVVIDEEYREPVMSAAKPMRAAAARVSAAAPMVASNPKPAFNWGDAPRETAPSMSRIEAARRGPTPDNPSLSLKKRLQRAAFFDQRERAVAAGKAVPISPMAGLPDALATPPVAKSQPARSPAPTFGLNRTFQPA